MQLCMYRYIHTSPWHPTQQKSSAGHSVRNDATTLAVSFWTVTGHAFQMWCFLHVTWQMLLFQSWSYSQKIRNDSIFNKAMPKKDIVHSDMHPKQMHNTFFRIASLTSGPSRLYISLAFHWHLKALVFFFSMFCQLKSWKKDDTPEFHRLTALMCFCWKIPYNHPLQSQAQGTTPMIYTMSVMELGLITVELNAWLPRFPRVAGLVMVNVSKPLVV